MGMPVGARARRETDVVAHAVGGAEDGVHVHFSREGLGGLSRGRVLNCKLESLLWKGWFFVFGLGREAVVSGSRRVDLPVCGSCV